ncbi:unnamed protein product [Didymodactylos carnosus]|uniref:BHLH domain-containing protein n=1 Tax=Didymodactylos carnosus TaxID=1234261 RepID=A0A814HZE0_9BILA|nr:unnamed protein product [Didymodactylos carnosus]CAF1017514.1 unnamed protein product [Didymodactylos carnosus]CAF3595024.1 unnamed protein product [Didymodactylos carnosus]CAF3789096.1 unnamed protein product [Didymodactylos carnosus]
MIDPDSLTDIEIQKRINLKPYFLVENEKANHDIWKNDISLIAKKDQNDVTQILEGWAAGYESGNDISYEQQQYNVATVTRQFSVFGGSDTINKNPQILKDDSKDIWHSLPSTLNHQYLHSTLTTNSNEEAKINNDENFVTEENSEEARDSLLTMNSAHYRLIQKKRRILSREQRKEANKRERRRMETMNDAYTNLRQILPYENGRKRRKMSRIDIVMGAIEYIHNLQTVLDDN